MQKAFGVVPSGKDQRVMGRVASLDHTRPPWALARLTRPLASS